MPSNKSKAYKCKYCDNLIYAATYRYKSGLCISCVKLGDSNPHWKVDSKFKKEHKCKECNTPISVYSSIYGKGRCSTCTQALRFKEDTSIKKHYYKNYIFRSGWELLFASWLDYSNIKWEYECKTFLLGKTAYTPNFYLNDFDCYIEIKGRLIGDAKGKFIKFKKTIS